jgi:predicted metal-dependent TIM-barrel fold hydrolase
VFQGKQNTLMVAAVGFEPTSPKRLVSVTIGLHPKNVGKVTNNTLKKIKSLLQMPKVVGLKKVGINHSVSPKF